MPFFIYPIKSLIENLKLLSADPSDHQDILNVADTHAYDTVLNAGSMDHLAAADVDTYVIGLSVVVMINEDDVSDLRAAKAYLVAVGALHVCSVRKPYAVVRPVAVHSKARTVKT